MASRRCARAHPRPVRRPGLAPGPARQARGACGRRRRAWSRSSIRSSSCWSTAAPASPPTASRFEGLMAGSRARPREVYPASEGFVAIADRGPGDGHAPHGGQRPVLRVRAAGRAGLRQSHPALGRPTSSPASTTRSCLTTCAGLWSYVIGDVVRVRRHQPAAGCWSSGAPSYMLSAFGEHVTGELVERSRPGSRGRGQGLRSPSSRSAPSSWLGPGRLGPPRPCGRVRRPTPRRGPDRRRSATRSTASSAVATRTMPSAAWCPSACAHPWSRRCPRTGSGPG